MNSGPSRFRPASLLPGQKVAAEACSNNMVEMDKQDELNPEREKVVINNRQHSSLGDRSDSIDIEPYCNRQQNQKFSPASQFKPLER